MTNNKSNEMNRFLDSFFGKRDGSCCVTCKSTKVKSEDFKDDLSRKEFGISCMCQKCQDEVFGMYEDE